MGRIRIGLSGWNYAAWRGDFYPRSLPRSDELSHVGARFTTVEVNSTFYGLLSPDTFRRWYRAVPADFIFAVKGSRFITHNKKLRGVAGAMANFLASGLLELDDKLGPMLWQVPANLRFDADRIDGFFRLLPHDTNAAVALAHRHDERVADVAFGPGTNHRIRHVFEVRHASYLCETMVLLARRHGVALAFSHSSAWPYIEEITAGFVYVRLHGPAELYTSPYGVPRLSRWRDRVMAWQAAGEPDDPVRVTERRPPERKSRDVYVYFDNDGHGHAPREAAQLCRLVEALPRGLAAGSEG